MGGKGRRANRAVSDVRRSGRHRGDPLRELRREVRAHAETRGRLGRPRPRGDPGDGPGGTRWRSERAGPAEAPGEARAGSRVEASSKARREAGPRERADERSPAQEECIAPRREDERAERAHERASRQDERPDERTHEWPYKRSAAHWRAFRKAPPPPQIYKRAPACAPHHGQPRPDETPDRRAR